MELDDDGQRVCRLARNPNGPDKWVIRDFTNEIFDDWVALCSVAIYRTFHGIGGDDGGRRYSGELILTKVLGKEPQGGD